MRKKLRLTYANVVATLALGLVLAGGTAVAAQKLVTSPKQIARGVVTNGKVKPGTLTADKLSPDALAALEGAAGQQGPEGPAGPAGPAGIQGPPGENGVTDVVIRRQAFRVPLGGSGTGRVDCQPGERAVGGGIGLTNGIPGEFSVWSSRPINSAGDSPAGATPTGWVASARNLDADGPGDQQARVWAICASP
jgi:hypothetical protein